MKFEEENAKYYKVEGIDRPKAKQGYVYFLMDKGEVVYVGQTTMGICRPLAHKDKQFDGFYMKKCRVSVLDKREREMILKYKPKYNGNFVNDDTLMPITKLKDELWRKGCKIRSLFVQRETEKLGIKPLCIKYAKSYTIKDARRLIKHIEKNWKEIEKEQDLSLQKVFHEDEQKGCYGFLYFICERVDLKEYCWLGAKSVKDLYYLGKITDEQIEKWRTEYEHRRVCKDD